MGLPWLYKAYWKLSWSRKSLANMPQGIFDGKCWWNERGCCRGGLSNSLSPMAWRICIRMAQKSSHVHQNDMQARDLRDSEDRCHSSRQSKAIYPLHPPLHPSLHHLTPSHILTSRDREMGYWSFICPWWPWRQPWWPCLACRTSQRTW